MIADLLAAQKDPCCAGLSIEQAKISDARIILLLHVGFDSEESRNQWWCVTASPPLSHRITENCQNYGKLADAAHPLVWEHTDAHKTLGFLGAPSNPRAVLGDLWLCHATLTEGWIPRYLLAPIDQNFRLLAEGHGFLTTGPARLMQAYARVLKSHNMEPYFAGEAKPTQETPSEEVKAFILGENYLVGYTLTAQRLHRRRKQNL